ncbi:hypothetical protein RJ55_02913 [Drechmeria coniospora]|nr:hypothetical protein RJ55_02913 [Drechmeria coniospora]
MHIRALPRYPFEDRRDHVGDACGGASVVLAVCSSEAPSVMFHPGTSSVLPPAPLTYVLTLQLPSGLGHGTTCWTACMMPIPGLLCRDPGYPHLVGPLIEVARCFVSHRVDASSGALHSSG